MSGQHDSRSGVAGEIRAGGPALRAGDSQVDAAALREIVDAVLESATDGRPAPIVQVGHPVLRQVALAWDEQLDEETLARLLEVMRRTMHDAPGVGLAAPQIGVPLQVAVLGDPGTAVGDPTTEVRERAPFDDRVLVNPTWRPVGEDRVTFYEGCLSVDGLAAATTRWRSVELHAWDETGAELTETLTGWPARIVQHEVDHLRGTLYLDHADSRSLSTREHAWQWVGEPSPHRAGAELGFEVDVAGAPGSEG